MPEMSSSQADPTVECDTCACEVERGGRFELVDGDVTCESCIRTCIIPKFQDALKSQVNWPVKWGPDFVLKPIDFGAYFDNWDDFQRAWVLKEVEYNTEPKNRLYCGKCNAFLRQIPYAPDEDENDSAFCRGCHIFVCGRCGIKGHRTRKCLTKDEEPRDPFKGMKDVKACPNCSSGYYLFSGCNSCDCRGCKKKFCWVCLEVSPKRDHWAPGKPCPKWNQPGEANAQWLDPAHDAAMEGARPAVVIPDEVLAFVPPSTDDPKMMGMVSDLAFLDTQFNKERTSALAMRVRRDLLSMPGLLVERKGETREARRADALAITNFVRERLEQAAGTVAGATDRLRAAGIAADVFRDFLRTVAQNIALFHDRSALELNLNDLLTRHLNILVVFRSISENDFLQKNYESLLNMLIGYLSVAPERLTVAASDRHQVRLHNFWEVEE